MGRVFEVDDDNKVAAWHLRHGKVERDELARELARLRAEGSR